MDFCILVDWIDGSTEDTSELSVSAENERDAILFAIAEWHQEAQQWPDCRITRVWVDDPAETASLQLPANLKVFPVSESPAKAGVKNGGAGRHNK